VKGCKEINKGEVEEEITGGKNEQRKSSERWRKRIKKGI
jgi:hypothetical protein